MAVVESRTIAFIESHENPLTAAETALVAVAGICGFKFSCKENLWHTLEEVDGKTVRTVVWTFDVAQKVEFKWVDAKGAARKEKLGWAEFRARVESPTWWRENLDHPLAYARQAAYGVRKLYAELRGPEGKPRHLVRASKTRFAVLRPDLTPEERAEALRGL